MTPTEPLPLHHSWALADATQRLDLGRLADPATGRGGSVALRDDPTRGRWHCDLADGRLDWSDAVFALFGLTPDRAPTRDAVLPLYAERSRAAMERLRAYAIRHRRGFTLDVEILSADESRRWVRLSAAPVCDGAAVIGLFGYKSDVTGLYARH